MKLKLTHLILLSLTLFSIHSGKKAYKDDYNQMQLRAWNTTKYTSYRPILDSIGQNITLKPNSSIYLTKFPFHISRCDQIVHFNATYIPDMGEYRNREEGWFTLTAHYANLFKTKNADKLIRSLLLSEITQEPHHLRGTGSCILIDAAPGEKSLTICLPDLEMQNNILYVLREFYRCRGGKLHNDRDKRRKLLACGGKFTNPRLLLKKLKEQAEEQEEVTKSLDFFHPGSDDIPGLPIVKKKEDPLKNLRKKMGLKDEDDEDGGKDDEDN